MPAEDSVLRLTLVVDGLGTVKTTMNEAATTVEASGQRMAVATREAGAAMTGLSNEAPQAASATRNLVPPFKEAEYSSTEAKHALRGMGEMAGIRMPRYVASFVTSLGPVGPLLATAFSAVAILALLDILSKLPAKIGEATDAIMGFGEKEKKAFEDAVQQNLRLLEGTLKTHEQLRALRELGATPLEKLRIESHNLTANLQEVGTQTGNLMRSQIAQRAQIEELTSGWSLWGTAAIGWIDGTDQHLKQLQASIENEQKLIDKWAEHMHELREIGTPKLKAETDTAGREEARATAEARLEAIKAGRLAELDFSKVAAKAIFDANIISFQDELTALRSIEDQKYEAERQYYEGRLSLARTSREREQITGQMAVLDTTHRTAIAEINAQEAADTRRIEAERIASEQRVVDAHIAGEKQWVSDSLALRRISIQESVAMEKSVETERYEAARKALTDEAALKRTDTVVLQKQLQALEIEHQNRLSQIDADGARRQMDETRNRLQEQISITEESANRELRSSQEIDASRLRMHQVTLSQWQADEEAAIGRWYDRQHQVLQDALDFAARTFGGESLEYQKALNHMNALDEQRAATLRRVDEQVMMAHQRTFERLNSEVSRSLTAWISGYQSFGRAAQEVYANLMSSIIEYLLKMLLQHVEVWVIEKVFHTATKAQEVATTAAAAGAEHAITSAENVGRVTSAAAVAAATAYAAYAWDPPLAEAMADIAFARTMAYAPVAAFEKGGLVPETGPAIVHAGELVVPAHLTQSVRNLLGAVGGPVPMRFSAPIVSGLVSGGMAPEGNLTALHDAGGRSSSSASSPASGGDVHLHYSPNLRSVDMRGMADLLEEHGEAISRIVNGQIRAGRIRTP